MSNLQHQNTQLYRRYMQNMLITYKNRQDLKLFIEILLTSITIVIFTLFAIKPTLTTISDLYTEMNVKKDTLATMDTKINNLQIAEGIYNSESQRLMLLETAVPDSPHPESFIRQIEGLAQKNSVILSGLTISDTNIIHSSAQPQATPESIDVTVRISAPYERILTFLADLESMRRPLFIKFGTINLGGEFDSNEITLSINGNIRFIPKPIENTTSL